MKIFESYIKALQKFPINTVAEHTYRKELQDLLEGVALQAQKDFLVQHEPKREESFGAPDFKIKTRDEAIIGYVENKKLTENLSQTIKSDQIKKYQVLSGNIILTNYIEWYWIKDREIIAKERLCDLSDIENNILFTLDPD